MTVPTAEAPMMNGIEYALVTTPRPAARDSVATVVRCPFPSTKCTCLQRARECRRNVICRMAADQYARYCGMGITPGKTYAWINARPHTTTQAIRIIHGTQASIVWPNEYG